MVNNQFKEVGVWNQGIPTYENGKWVDDTFFDTKEEFIEYLEGIFKEPGEYNFDSTTEEMNRQARNFDRDGFYCIYAFKTKDYINYWEDQKKKSRRGVIFKSGNLEWYLTRELYFWVNFLQIYDKIKKEFQFPKLWDVQYHMALYEKIAELKSLDAAVMKKRQIASSYYHAAKLINEFWFEEGSTMKMGASDEDYINNEGTWMFLEQYKDFLNTNTGWYRPTNPGKEKLWIQKIKTRRNGRDIEVGNKSKIQGLTLDKSPTKGVGGAIKYFFYEEAGITKTMDKTHIYIKSATGMGEISTGQFIAAGSVGELTECEPLKEMILNPIDNGIYAVPNRYFDETGTVRMTGLFIPEQWGMPPYIDINGNSQVESALQSLNDKYAEMKQNMQPHLYQLEISQRPRNLKEALDHREENFFPIGLLTDMEERFSNKEYPVEYVELVRNIKTKEINIKRSNKTPILEFPVSRKRKDKEGVICMYKRPEKKPKWGRYLTSIDPVAVGKTTESDSLASIYVYELPVEEVYSTDEGQATRIVGGEIVCSWAGRFDDIFDTYRILENIIEVYNAWTLVENNITGFITYMISQKKQYYLIPKDQIVFLKEISGKTGSHQPYGWRNVGNMFKNQLRHSLRDFLTEVISVETTEPDNDGNFETKDIFGIQRIPDPMAIKEMKAYKDGLNVDRLVSLSALVAFVRIHIANRGYGKVIVDEEVEMDKSIYKPKKNAFKSIGNNNLKNSPYIRSRGGFKNIG